MNKVTHQPLSEQEWETLDSLVRRLPAELEYLDADLAGGQECADVVDQFSLYILEAAMPAALMKLSRGEMAG